MTRSFPESTGDGWRSGRLRNPPIAITDSSDPDHAVHYA